jgi:hypothetical protein
MRSQPFSRTSISALIHVVTLCHLLGDFVQRFVGTMSIVPVTGNRSFWELMHRLQLFLSMTLRE